MPIAPSIDALLRDHAAYHLDVGCGPAKQEGPHWIGLDESPHPGVDIVAPLLTFPWPLPDHRFTTILLQRTFNRIPGGQVARFMAEIHRISRHGATILLNGPYGLGFNFQRDFTHVTPVNELTFAYFDPTQPATPGLRGMYWKVHQYPTIFHLASFSRVAAGAEADYNASLIVCKGGCARCQAAGVEATVPHV